MANEKNLIPFNKMAEKQQREIAKKGGKASAAKKKRQKTLKSLMLMLLSFPTNGKGAKILKEIGFDCTETNNASMLVYSMFDAAVNRGDMKAAKAIMDLIGAGEIFEIKKRELKLKESAIKSAEAQGNQTSSAMQQLVNTLMASDA